jgi:hypothetical protein
MVIKLSSLVDKKKIDGKYKVLVILRIMNTGMTYYFS